jgi:hypothetical protein
VDADRQIPLSILTTRNPLSVLPLSAELVPHRLPCGQVPILLICALNGRWNGDCTLTTDDENTIQLSFERGTLTAWTTREGEELHWKHISERLPKEHVSFARDFAKNQALEAFATLRRLVLLPEDVLQAIRQSVLLEQIHHFGSRAGFFHYHPSANEAPARLAWTLGAPIEALEMISQVLLQSQDLKWCHEVLSENFGERIVLSNRLRVPSLTPSSDLSKVVQAIAAKPESLESLALRNLVSDDALFATVYVLAATGNASFPWKSHASSSATLNAQTLGHQAPTDPVSPPESNEPTGGTPELDFVAASVGRGNLSRRPTGDSGVRRMDGLNSTQSADSWGSESSAGPSSAGPSSAGPSSAGPSSAGPSSMGPASLNETSAEASCLKAWMRAEGDPNIRPRALSYISKARRHFPRNSSILFYLGSVQTLMGHTAAAEGTLKRVLELEPKHSEAERTLRYLQGAGGSKKAHRPAT